MLILWETEWLGPLLKSEALPASSIFSFFYLPNKVLSSTLTVLFKPPHQHACDRQISGPGHLWKHRKVTSSGTETPNPQSKTALYLWCWKEKKKKPKMYRKVQKLHGYLNGQPMTVPSSSVVWLVFHRISRWLKNTCKEGNHPLSNPGLRQKHCP